MYFPIRDVENIKGALWCMITGHVLSIRIIYKKTKKYYKKTGAEQLDVFAPSMTVPHDDEIKKYIEENSNETDSFTEIL